MKTETKQNIIVSIFWLVFLIILFFHYNKPTKIKKYDLIIQASRSEYFHYEFFNINVKFNNAELYKLFSNSKFYARIKKDNKFITTIGNVRTIELKKQGNENKFSGRFPCPWNAPEGDYEIFVIFPLITVNIPDFICDIKSFKVIRKKDNFKIKTPILCATLESLSDFSTMKVKNIDGSKGNAYSLLDWTKYAGGNTFWHLAFSTTYYSKRLKESFPWVADNISRIPDMANEAHKRGLKFGSWIICFLTFGEPGTAPEKYNYAIDFSFDKGLYKTRAISISDEKRIKDIIKAVKILNEIKEVDYIGLDYIRNALGGYELCDEFFSDMDIKLPYENMSKEARMIYLAKTKIARKNMHFIDKWQWWRAQKIAHIIRRIKEEVKLNKPLWTFTLSWEMGHQHGQDPPMMNDAGVDIDAIMMYEANAGQYKQIISDWNNYLSSDDVNLIAGNVIDWPLHQKIINPPGPEEYYRRKMEAVEKLYSDGPIKGIFLHDLARLLWGRRGPYSMLEWWLAGGAAFTKLNKLYGVYDYDVTISTANISKTEETSDVKIILTNFSNENKKIKIEFPKTPGIEVLENENVENLSPKQIKIISKKFRITENLSNRNFRYMFVFRALSGNKVLIDFKYIKI